MDEGSLKNHAIATTLDLPPSCIEFSQASPEYFVVGTYNLEKDDAEEPQNDQENDEDDKSKVEVKTQERNGSLILYRLENDELSLIYTVTHPAAILDLHFSPFFPQIIAVASSTGSISLYKLEQTPRPHLALLQTFQLFPESTLVLSLAWHPSHSQLLGCTLNTSTVALLSLSPDFTQCSVLRDELSPHDDLEAWTLAFSPARLDGKTMPQALYSGGDDSKLRCLAFSSLASLSHPLEEITAASPGGSRGMRGHEAGVTAILPIPLGTEAGQDILLTGSYDDTVRVFAVYDYRSGQKSNPKVLVEKKLGGGVWRLKFMDKESEKVADGERCFRVLASCMHAGARILEVRGSREGEWTIEVLARFEEHKSMNYGSDVQPLKKKDWRGNKNGDEGGGDDDGAKERSIVSTSFYDRLLCDRRGHSAPRSKRLYRQNKATSPVDFQSPPTNLIVHDPARPGSASYSVPNTLTTVDQPSPHGYMRISLQGGYHRPNEAQPGARQVLRICRPESCMHGPRGTCESKERLSVKASRPALRCDETKPTCTQCRKSRRECPGYKDDFDLVFRNETQATEKRAKKPTSKARKAASQAPSNRQWNSNAAPPVAGNPNSALVPSSTPAQVPTTLSIPVEQVASHYFFTNFVATSDNGASIGLTDYIIPLANASQSNKHLSLAFSAASLAAFGNRPSGKALLTKAQEQYSKAIRHVNYALRDPVLQKTDETLASVMLLGMYETILSRPVAMAAWGSHIDGAVMLVKMRGKKQLQTKVGNALFIAVRSLMYINCLSTGKKPDWGIDVWRSDDAEGDIREIINRLAIEAAELRYEINGLMTLAERTPENTSKVQDAMRRSWEMEQMFQDWIAKLPNSWRFTTVAWVKSISSDQLLDSEVYPGRIDTFPDVWIANVWTLLRVTRLFVSGAVVRCAAWLNTSVDYRTTPEYAAAARLGTDAVNDIVAGIPFHLGWRGSESELKRFAVAGDNCFSFGDNQNKPRALGAYLSTWPVFSAYCSDFATDAQRTWLKGRLNYITDVMGINQAGTLALYQLRLPSMTIKRDLMSRAALLTHQLPNQVYTPPSTASVSPPHSNSTVPSSSGYSAPQGSAYNPSSTSSPPTNLPPTNLPTNLPTSLPPGYPSAYSVPPGPINAPQIPPHLAYLIRQESPPDEHVLAAIESSGQKQWEQWERERRKRELERKKEALVEEGTGGDEMLAELLKRYFQVGMMDKE
ncbi:hypothetical protein V494_01614 [Pseudogymnoascus sp. VKM F-4513 (FW-928)]|nr:hypothetical protein V494_01614 [Pseudogymnoascus sp. VKM F-4513 (FW-928)]